MFYATRNIRCISGWITRGPVCESTSWCSQRVWEISNVSCGRVTTRKVSRSMITDFGVAKRWIWNRSSVRRWVWICSRIISLMSWEARSRLMVHLNAPREMPISISYQPRSSRSLCVRDISASMSDNETRSSTTRTSCMRRWGSYMILMSWVTKWLAVIMG